MRFTGVLAIATAVVTSLPGAATAVPSARLLPASLTVRLETGRSRGRAVVTLECVRAS